MTAADPQPPTQSPASWRTLALGVAATVVVLAVAGFLAAVGARDDAEEAAQDRPPVADGDQPALDDRVSPTETAPLPDATLDGFGGGDEVSTRDYRGTPLILNFWASWCPPCVEEMPDLQEVASAGGHRLALLGINVQDDPDKAASLVEDLHITYDLAADPDASLFRDVRAFGMPTTLFVSADGEIRYRHTGPLDASTIIDLADEHLGVDPP